MYGPSNDPSIVAIGICARVAFDLRESSRERTPPRMA